LDADPDPDWHQNNDDPHADPSQVLHRLAVVSKCDEIIAQIRALIFVKKIKVVIGTFYFNGAMILKYFIQCNWSLVFKSQTRPLLFPRKSTLSK
jgi:hypothetical protein